MIKLNLENAINESVIEKYKPIVKELSTKMKNLDSLGADFLGWQTWPSTHDAVEFKNIEKKAKELWKEGVNTLVVIGIGGSFAGAKAGIEMIQGEYPLKRKMEIIFVGESVSSTNLAQKLSYVENKNFAINIISKSGTTMEPSVSFRLFKELLRAKVGRHNASKFIIATTDANRGALLKEAKQEGYTSFVIPNSIGGRFSVLTAVGMFPMACVGINIAKIMKGAKNAEQLFSDTDLGKNLAYQYAVARFVLTQKFPVELMVQYEPQMKAFNEWWKQLAGESEGKNQKGVFPASAIFSTDLHSLGQFIQEGSKVLFETVITVKEPIINVSIPKSQENYDGLNYLTGKTIDEINKTVFEATKDAHVRVGKVPNIHIEIEKMTEVVFGSLVYFFEQAISMTAYLQGVNPFNQPGVEVYKANMFNILKKED